MHNIYKDSNFKAYILTTTGSILPKFGTRRLLYIRYVVYDSQIDILTYMGRRSKNSYFVSMKYVVFAYKHLDDEVEIVIILNLSIIELVTI